MPIKLKNTIAGLLAISALLFGIGILVFDRLFPAYYFSLFPYLIITFFLFNSGFFIFFFYSLKKSDKQFVRNFMAATGIKTLFYFMIILIYVLKSPVYAIPFSITLLILYAIYTAYDLYVMLRLLKRKKENKDFPNHFSN